MDFDALVAQLKSHAGRSDSSATTVATAALNNALRSIEQEANWYWMEQVKSTPLGISPTSPRDRVTLPTDWKEIRLSPHYTDELNVRHTLLPLSEDEANERYATDTIGEPEFYRVWKGQIFIYPPDRTTIRTLRMPYWAWSQEISGAQTNELSIRWPNLWITRGMVEYALALRDFKLRDAWLGTIRNPQPGTYLYELRQLRAVNNRRRMPRVLKVRGGSLPGGGRRNVRRFWQAWSSI